MPASKSGHAAHSTTLVSPLPALHPNHALLHHGMGHLVLLHDS
jgi:hypothetical protein